VAIGFGAAILPILIAQMLKPRVQWITRLLPGWIADKDHGSSK
jgi:hypothetical protein